MLSSRFFRRYHLFSLLSAVCLLVALLAGPIASQAGPTPNASQQVESSPAKRQLAIPQKAEPLSLTQNVRKTVLENGLTVLTKEVKTAPVVTAQVWYRIGSRNETAGVNGIAHQLEHLMFKGTRDRPIQFGRFFSALGSESNAFTSYDMTAYFGTVQRNKLNALLVLEADRMQNALINDDALTSEKRVVISELQGYENSPSYRLGRSVMRAVFPNSPYGLPVGGTKADVEKFTVEQVREYYRNFYSPNNATLILVGNFQTDEVLKQVRETFGKVPRSAIALPSDPATPLSPPHSNSSSPRPPIILKEPGSAALLNAVYPLPNVVHPDVPALQVMDTILSSGRSSRLYQALVESGLASEAGGYITHLIGSGWYQVSATATPGKKLNQIDQALQQAIADLQQNGVLSEELERAKAQLRASIILRNQTITSQALQLGDDQLTTGDYRFTDRLLTEIAKVTAADVQRVARTYLTPANRALGFFEPIQSDGKPGSAPATFSQTSEQFSPGAPVDPAEVAKYLPPIPPDSANQITQPLPEKLTLANGLQVLLLPDHSMPVVNLSGHIQAGTAFDQAATAGLASLTAENLMNGTQTQDYLAIAKTLENRGANLGLGANREGVMISGNALATDLPILIQVLADVLRNATFPADQLELSRQQALTNLKVELDNPLRLGRRVFQQTVYPENHPFHSFPTETSLKRITRDDVLRFYRQQYHPDATVLTLVGDFNPAEVRSLLNQQFGSWEDTTENDRLTFPPVPLPTEIVRRNPTLPGKTQSITYLGYQGIDRKDPRYYAVAILNEILGGDTLSSRLGTEIRDRLGLTYGIYSIFQAGLYQGPFLVMMQTAPEDTEQAITSTLALLEQIREKGMTAAEVDTAKRAIISNYGVGLANPTNVANTILTNSVYGLNLNEIRQFPDKINAVTLAAVNQTIAELLHPDRVVLVTAGPGTSASQK
jgi:zinc protease